MFKLPPISCIQTPTRKLFPLPDLGSKRLSYPVLLTQQQTMEPFFDILPIINDQKFLCWILST